MENNAFQRHSHTGLTAEEVLRSRQQHGANTLTPSAKTPLWRLYLEKYRDPIIQILLVAAAISFVLAFINHDFIEIIGILAAIFLATTVGFWFEVDAQKKFDVLTALSEEQPVKVIRSGEVVEVARRDVVVGDIVLVEAGDEVPADGRLIESRELTVDESSLTGEPHAMKFVPAGNPQKTPISSEVEAATYPADLLLRSSLVMDGRGMMRVTAVGDSTEIGQVAVRSSEQTDVVTPLNRQLSRLASLISKVGTGVAVAAFLIFLVHDIIAHPDFWQAGNVVGMANQVLKYFMMAVTLIVMAVPEGLPMAVTLSLALNMKRMLTTGNLVRNLQASETMGAVTVICTDKTGTLTENKMTITEMLTYDAALLKEAIALNSTAELNGAKGIGNPTEVALLRWLQEQQVDYVALRESVVEAGQIPFSTERKYMATATDGYIFVKGAPEIILQMCQGDASSDVVPVDSQALSDNLLSMQRRGMRTLALCYQPNTLQQPLSTDNLPRDGYRLQAIVGISDPVRKDVASAVDQCRQAGIEVKIVTGDTSATAVEIARQIGLIARDVDIDSSLIINGKQWEQLSDAEAAELSRRLIIISRARPADKQRLVDLLRAQGQVVAVTGDGTNDAPALHHAHVGLSLGSGTSVAKNASDITLLDDSFGAIAKAVMWGRSLYRNIQRFLFFQLVVNLSALLLVLAGSLVGTELPLTVTQILWVNLIMDTFAALALASLPPSREVMGQKPRQSSEFIITKPIWKTLLTVALLFFGVMFSLLIYCERHGNSGIDIHELTVFFTIFVMLQLWNLFNAKALGSAHSAFHNLVRSQGFVLVVLLIVLGQVVIVHFGGKVFRTVPLSVGEWITIICATSVVLWVGEIIRLCKRIR